MELSLRDIRDIANQRANRLTNKITVYQAVLLTLVFVSLIAMAGFALNLSIQADKAESQKITYSIPVPGDLVYEKGIFTINGYLVKPDQETKTETDYWCLACLLLFLFSFLLYIAEVIASANKEKNRIIDYYLEHKELPKEG